ncbi:class A beta-lactamase [Gryllotalpicola daejeonensis]|uniref:Beta-lactamase n=1 Tax=Gryllotalpicola daejeonensis TaxID=993087 RepID=A0ABP7ZM72_9MICO
MTLDRRGLLGLGLAGSAALVAGLTGCTPTAAAADVDGGGASEGIRDSLLGLEKEAGVTIGVHATNAVGRSVFFRPAERFPLCSTFKVLAVGALLKENSYNDRFWQTPVAFTAADIVENSPITSRDPDRTMTYSELADAALRYSDNTAGNLLLKRVGGPAAITSFARSLGAAQTRLDRWEPQLNAAVPGDLRDTSTPADLDGLYRALLIGDALDQLGRARLLEWMLRNTTSAKRIGAVLPAHAELADKTGAGDYGVVNDVGVVFAPESTISVAIMTRSAHRDATGNNDVVARTAAVVLEALA